MTHFIPTLFLVMMTCLLLSGCDTTDNEDPIDPRLRLTDTEQEIIEADNSFGLKLYQALHANEPNENLFISPLSVSLALGMAMNGADGDTRDEMAEVLEKSGLSEQAINESYETLVNLLSSLDEKVILNIANSIWYREEFNVNDDFLNKNTRYFNAEVTALDFNAPESVDEINGWVDQKTNGLINSIIDSIDRETLLYLINAIYFKGDWTYQFDPEFTEESQFFNLNGPPSPTNIMSLRGTFQYDFTDQAAYIDLPYGDSLFTMTIVLPHNSEDMASILNDPAANILSEFDREKTYSTVDLFLPKFTLEYKASLGKMLQSLGMEKAFLPQQADFSRISTAADLHISHVIHKTFVEISEEGTEAAAVTAVGIGTTSVGENVTPVIRVDKPFLFFIRENSSGAYIFAGKVITL